MPEREVTIAYDCLGVPWMMDRRAHRVWCATSWVLAIGLVVLAVALWGNW